MLTESQLMNLRLDAASDSYFGGNPVLVKLFDQYVMLKTLNGI